MGETLLDECREARKSRGFTLVEVLVVLAIIPLVLAITFSAVSVALRAYRLAEARSALSAGAMVVMETLGQDLRGAREIYEDSSSTRFHGRLQNNLDVLYEFTPPAGSEPGTLSRNGAQLFGSETSVTSCEFAYLAPGPDPGGPLQEVSDVRSASSIRVSLTVERRSSSMTFESVFDLRNL